MMNYIWTFPGDITQAEEQHILSSTNSNIRKDDDRKLGSMHEETRELLEEFYHVYNEDLAAMFSDTKFLWRDKRTKRGLKRYLWY